MKAKKKIRVRSKLYPKIKKTFLFYVDSETDNMYLGNWHSERQYGGTSIVLKAEWEVV